MDLIKNQFYKLAIITVFLIGSTFSYAQKVDFKSIQTAINSGKNYTAIKLIKSYDQQKLKKYNIAQLKILSAKAYSNELQTSIAFNELIDAQKILYDLDSIEKAIELNLEISSILVSNTEMTKRSEKYIVDFIDYAEKNNKRNLIAKGYLSLAVLKMEKNPKASIALFKKALSSNFDNDESKISIYNNLGVLYNEILEKPDSALYYYDKSFEIIQKKNDKNDICTNYINKAACFYYKADFKKSIGTLQKANSISINKYTKNLKSHIQLMLSMNYEALGDFENSFKSLKLHQELETEVSQSKQNIKILELETKYKTKEKEIENVSLKSGARKNKILFFALVGLLILVTIAVVLAYINLLNKKKIETQIKLIENQRLENELKNQELLSIDSILESQEKERQNIANELHDNLGSILVTLKLNFENLKSQKSNWNEYEDKLYFKTNNLIDEAYQEVRNISHLKNLGAFANDGLLKEIYDMSEKMSVLNKLKINVIPFGLNNRIENSKEVFIFRMIQELCTNVIKHSNAFEVNIYLTQHKVSEINIIVEDNGIGFDISKTNENIGIGLKNLEKKVEYMGGSFTIDSHIGKGTTIIIDMPL